MNFKRKLWWAQHKEQIFRIYAITLTLVLVILGIIYFSYSKFSSSNEMTMYETTVEPFIKNDYFIASYIDGEWSNEIPGKGDGYVVDKIVCDNEAVGTWDNDKWAITIENATKKIKCSVFFKEKIQFNFDYTGTEQVFTVPKTGTYKIEVWGAQGGAFSNEASGGAGGYSSGILNLNLNEDIYINVGSTDLKKCNDIGNGSYCEGGYNGGGTSQDSSKEQWGAGGGATHVATISGLLSNLNNDKDKILIVAGGGGGAYSGLNGASGGGFQGNNGADRTDGSEFKKAYGGTQVAAGTGYKIGGFGYGGSCRVSSGMNCSGGGAGFYGGAGAYGINGAGGSGYIGNSLLTDKTMYCYNCEESSEESTKTVSTTCAEETPTENCAKKGNGYARITYIG